MADRHNPLGRHAARIESEYLERLNKVRFGMDSGWRPPGLLLKGGTAGQRREALDRLEELAIQDGFFASLVTIAPGRDRSRGARGALRIGSFVAGPLAGWLVETYIRGGSPNTMWYVLSGIGLASTAAMVIYNAVLARTMTARA